MDVGNLVKANDANALVVINQISPIYVKFSLPEENLRDIQQQARLLLPVEARFKQTENNQDLIEKGTLSFIDNAVDSTTGMILIKATFPNEDQKLCPGQ